MNEALGVLKKILPELPAEAAFRVFELQHQYQYYCLGLNVERLSFQEFQPLWQAVKYLGKNQPEVPIEFQLASLLANNRWPGKHALATRIKSILDETMVIDELEEVRRLYLQNIFSDGELDLIDVSAHLLPDQRWMWVLNPSWATVYTREEKIGLLRLKYEFFEKLGWLKNATEQNPVIRFQLAYLANPQIDILELLHLDMDIQQGSEIFLRLTEVNPFLVSYFYNCYKQKRMDLLSNFELRDL